MSLSSIPLIGLFIFAGVIGPEKEPAQASRINEVRRGMSPSEVKALLGPPSRMCRQILVRRHLEQWQYDDQGWIEFECIRGEEPSVDQKSTLPSSL